MTDNSITIRNISKSFVLPDKSQLTVLSGLSLTVEKGTEIAITGVSGSGKSTLLHLIGGLDKPDSGEIAYQGRSILNFPEKEMAHYRNRNIGFIYQFHYLMPELNTLENVAFPFLMHNFDKDTAYAAAENILNDVGLADKLLVMPYQLSGGERQRAAIARSLINNPQLLLADEPTGNLDWQTGSKVFGLFRELIAEKGLTAIIVTHNETISKMMDHSYRLQAGKLI